MVNYGGRLAEDKENEDFSSSSEEDEEEVKLNQPKENATYNTAAIHEKLEDISWTDSSWIDSLLEKPFDDEAMDASVDVNDDLAREMSFYSLALEGAKSAFQKLQELGIPFLRPSDYYAEMVKSDAHMLKVKDRLLAEQRQLAEAEERRKQRESKRYSKEVQAEKQKERTKQKKADMESVKKWRKVRQKSDFTEGAEDFPVDAVEGGFGPKKVAARMGDRGTPKGGRGGSQGSGLSKKRQARDTKFGFGGRKKLKKQNTAESTGEMDGFKASRKNDGFFGARGGKGGKGRGGKQQRPGKQRRQNMAKNK